MLQLLKHFVKDLSNILVPTSNLKLPKERNLVLAFKPLATNFFKTLGQYLKLLNSLALNTTMQRRATYPKNLGVANFNAD